MNSEKNLAIYLQKVFSDFEIDNDKEKAIRRLNIKQLHIMRKEANKRNQIIDKSIRILKEL